MGICLQKQANLAILSTEQVPIISNEEKTILAHEANHIFAKKDFKDLAKSIKSESYEGALSVAQLKRAFSDLEIPISELSDPDTATFRILSRTKNEKKLLDLKKLSLLAILLGKGKISDKSE